MLRKLDGKDVQRMLEWMHDPNVSCNFRANFNEMTESEARSFIESSFNETHQNFAFTNPNDDYLGTISLKNISTIDLSAEYAIVTRSDAQGTGCALDATMGLLRYAFQELGLHRIYLNVLEKNIRANRFYAKCGFSFEGKFKDHLFLHGTFENLNWYGMLKEEFMELKNIRFDKFDEFLRPVTMGDAHTLFDWANDPVTRRNSFSTEAIPWENHLNWLDAKLKSKTSNLYILSNGIERIGTIRLDYSEGRKTYLISYNIGSQFRGKGYGTKILSLVEHEAREKRKQGIDAISLIGEVKQNNYASIRCFEKNGYQLQADNELGKTFCKML